MAPCMLSTVLILNTLIDRCQFTIQTYGNNYRCRRKINLRNVCELPIRYLKQCCFWDVQGSFGWVIKIALWKCGSLNWQNICVRVVTSLELCRTCQRVSLAEKPGTICLPESLPYLSLHYTLLAAFTKPSLLCVFLLSTYLVFEQLRTSRVRPY